MKFTLGNLFKKSPLEISMILFSAIVMNVIWIIVSNVLGVLFELKLVQHQIDSTACPR